MMRYKAKFNLLRDEVVKANNELVDNKVFETYMDEEQDTVTIYEGIVKALVNTIKFYEQADHKIDTSIIQKIEDARQELATNNAFKAWLDFYLNDYYIDINEATALALPKTIWQLEEIVRDYKKELKKQDVSLEKAQETIENLNKENKDFKHANLDLTKELSKQYQINDNDQAKIHDLQLELDFERKTRQDAERLADRKSDHVEGLESYIKKLKEQIKTEQIYYNDTNEVCNRMASCITKLERENEELKEQDERYKTDNKNLCKTVERLNKANGALENEISEISALFNEQVDRIIKRDNEIYALKHILDRKDNE